MCIAVSYTGHCKVHRYFGLLYCKDVFIILIFSVYHIVRCDAVWEVSLENGRHKVTLRSALEIVNNCGTRLEVQCSTGDAVGTAAEDEGHGTKVEVVGVVSYFVL